MNGKCTKRKFTGKKQKKTRRKNKEEVRKQSMPQGIVMWLQIIKDFSHIK